MARAASTLAFTEHRNSQLGTCEAPDSAQLPEDSERSQQTCGGRPAELCGSDVTEGKALLVLALAGCAVQSAEHLRGDLGRHRHISVSLRLPGCVETFAWTEAFAHGTLLSFQDFPVSHAQSCMGALSRIQ